MLIVSGKLKKKGSEDECLAEPAAVFTFFKTNQVYSKHTVVWQIAIHTI